MNENLGDRAIKGIFWNGISLITRQGIQFVTVAILAHLLFPEDFGIIAMAFVFTGLMTTVNDLGLASAIIQRKTVTQEQLSSCFWVGISMGILLCGIIITTSRLIANFYHEPLVQPVISILSFGFIIGSIGIIHRSLLVREIEFKKLAFIEIGAVVGYGAISIPMAIMGFGVWSLVWGELFRYFITTISVWIVCKWHPEFIFRYKPFRELLGFGANVMGANLLNYISYNVDYLLTGRFLGPASLGYYRMGYRLADLPHRTVSPTVTKVSFPAFSKVQEDNERLQKGYLKTITYISLINFPLLFGLIIVAPEFIKVVYGSKWIPAILPTQILCIAGLIYSIVSATGTIFLSKGRADIAFKWTIVNVVTLFIAVLIGIRFGIIGVAIAIAVRAIIVTPFCALIANWLIDLRFKHFLSSLLPAIEGSLVMVIVLSGYLWVARNFFGISDIWMLISSIVIGALLYLSTIKIVNPEVLTEGINIFRRVFK